jgi:hypothetical protein
MALQIKVTGSFKPEPVLSKSAYEEILRIMKNMAPGDGAKSACVSGYG